MARLGAVLTLEPASSISVPTTDGIRYRDTSGAEVFVPRDVLAHLLSIYVHEQGRHGNIVTSVEALLDELCTCKKAGSK